MDILIDLENNPGVSYLKFRVFRLDTPTNPVAPRLELVQINEKQRKSWFSTVRVLGADWNSLLSVFSTVDGSGTSLHQKKLVSAPVHRFRRVCEVQALGETTLEPIH